MFLRNPGDGPGQSFPFVLVDVYIFEQDRILVRGKDGTHQLQKGGFSGPIGTDDGDEISLFDVQGYVLKHLFFVIGKRKVPDF